MSKSTAKKPSRLNAIKSMPKRAAKFLSSMWSEVKKKELMQHTSVVLGLVVIMAIIFWITDLILRFATAPLL